MADALSSLYGKGHVNATRTRECVAMPGKREQTILTPDYLLEAVRYVFNGQIYLDPCSSGDDNVNAIKSYVWPQQDGLRERWTNAGWGTFYNPPYGELKKWLAKRNAEVANGADELIGLIPLRPHRKWFDLRVFDLVCFLDPVKFVGFKQAYPASLVMVYDGKRQHAFREAFGPLGRVCKVVG